MWQGFLGGVMGFVFMTALTGLFSLSLEGPSRRPTTPNISLVRTTSDGQAVRWDIKDCLWRDTKSGEIILADGGEKEMSMWRQCRLEQRSKEPKILWGK